MLLFAVALVRRVVARVALLVGLEPTGAAKPLSREPARSPVDLCSGPALTLYGPGGEVWRLWADGRVEGFPDGTIVCNAVAPLFDALLSAQKQRPGAAVAAQNEMLTRAQGETK